MKDEMPESERLKREMYVHLEAIRDRCNSLMASKYPLDVYNEVQSFRSLVGQLSAAAVRWRHTK